MNLHRWSNLLPVFLGAWGVFALILREVSAAFLAAMFATVLMKAIFTKELNIGRYGPVRIVGPSDGWYWTFLVLFSLCLFAVLLAAEKRDVRTLFSSRTADYVSPSRGE